MSDATSFDDLIYEGSAAGTGSAVNDGQHPSTAERSSTAIHTAKKRPSRGFRIVTRAIPAALILAAGGYTAACAFAPLPDPVFTPADSFTESISASDGATRALVDRQPLPTAVGWLPGDNAAVWSNDDGLYSLGSITKLIMMLVAIEHKPLEPGSDGETYVWTYDDAALTAHYQSLDGVAFNIPVGAELTQRQMMELIFLPSANDVAHAYALWVFGSNEAFLAALDEWKVEHGLESISLTEPTGMDAADVATAADIVRVTRLAVEQPTIAEFNAMQFAELPWGIGVVENSNPLLGVVQGVVGTKTGTINYSYNLATAQRVQIGADGTSSGEREVVNISVTLDRSSQEERAWAGGAMLEAMAELPQEVVISEEGEALGSLRSVDGQSADLSVSETHVTTLLPGETVTRSFELEKTWTELGAGTSGSASADLGNAGTLTVHTPEGDVGVAIRASNTFEAPTLWWRLTHPRELFG